MFLNYNFSNSLWSLRAIAATVVPLAAYRTELLEIPITEAISPATDVTAPILTNHVATYIATIPVTPNLTIDLRVLIENPLLDLLPVLRLERLDLDFEEVLILYSTIEKKWWNPGLFLFPTILNFTNIFFNRGNIVS